MTLKAVIFHVSGPLAEFEKRHLIAYNATFERAKLNWGG